MGGIFGGLALSSKSAANCPNKVCSPQAWRELDSAKSRADASTVGFVVAGTAFATGIVTWWLWPESRSKRELTGNANHIAPWFAPGIAGGSLVMGF